MERSLKCMKVGDGGEGRKSKVCLATLVNSYLESTFYDYSYINFGRLAESSHRVDVVVEDDDPNHHPHAKHQCFFTREPAPVLPGRDETAALLLSGPSTFVSGSSNPLLRTIPDLQPLG